MKNILNKKQFIINKKGDKVGFVLDMDTYSKIEGFFEDFVLGKKMDKAKKSKSYNLKGTAKKARSL